MSVITKSRIVERVKRGEIIFKPPLDTFQLQDHSVDLRLGFTFLIPKTWHLTERGRETVTITHLNKAGLPFFDVVELEEGQYFELLPHEYVLVSTLESVKLPNDIMAVLYPRSSTNRKGLSLDLTGIIDCGFEGQLTLPVRSNAEVQVIRLFPGERICQIVFETLDESITPRRSKYHKRDIVEGVGRESVTEVRLIMRGRIRELKDRFAAILEERKK